MKVKIIYIFKNVKKLIHINQNCEIIKKLLVVECSVYKG
jgi:hypothetical protein